MDARPILVVELPVPKGREDEWNTWYHDVHIPDVLANVDGAVTSRRYRLLDGDETYIYLVIHEFESEEQLARYYASTAVSDRWVDYDAQWGMPGHYRRRAFTPIWAARRPE
jgi:Domain of unknown function (DUF4286)